MGFLGGTLNEFAKTLVQGSHTEAFGVRVLHPSKGPIIQRIGVKVPTILPKPKPPKYVK